VGLIPVFGRDQRRKGHQALLPPFFLSDPLILATLGMKMMLVATYMCAFMLLPFYLQTAKQWTPDEAATLLLWRPLVFAVFSFFVGKKIEKLWVCAKAIVIGTVVFTTAVLLMTFCLDLHWAYVFAGVLLQGIGAGLLFPCLATASFTRVAQADMGVINHTLCANLRDRRCRCVRGRLRAAKWRHAAMVSHGDMCAPRYSTD
jgi:predicted MFS family arabinose efflux permease